MIKSKILNYWSSRAKSKSLKCSNDRNLELAEIKYIKKIIRKNSKVLDIGCGDGELLRQLKKKLNIKAYGFDFSPKLIQIAKRKSKNINYYCLDMLKLDHLKKELKINFDYIITKRSIQNLVSWNSQKNFINSVNIFCHKKTKILFFECSSSATEQINKMRKTLNLKKIVMPWFNLYLNDKKIISTKFKKIKLVKIQELFSTYFFVSRVINAYHNEKNNSKPKYNDHINLGAWKLPQKLTEGFSQLKLYIFKIK